MLVCLYLIYRIHVWDKAYNTHINDLIVLQKKAVCIVNVVRHKTSMHKLCIEKDCKTHLLLRYWIIHAWIHKHHDISCIQYLFQENVW